MIRNPDKLRRFEGDRIRGGFLVLVLAALAALPQAARGAAQREISGRKDFAGEVVVPAGETWRVLPGSEVRFTGGRWVVRGTLRVEGSKDRPVRIAGDDSFEGIDFRGGDGSSVSRAVIAGGRRGAQATNAKVSFREVRFEKNGIGLDVGQYAQVSVEDCGFESPSRVGLLVKRGGAVAVKESRFAGAGKAGALVYGVKEARFERCRFEGNEAGLTASMPGAEPVVADCTFRENRTGLLAEKLAAPRVEGGEFRGNRVGLHFTRRSEGTVTGCRIGDNGDGVLVEYSSYPVFRKNVFADNREYAVRLRNQSSEWEEELGDTDREGSPGSPFGPGPGVRTDFLPGGGTSPPGPAPKRENLSGTVDFRENDWGGAQADGENLAAVHDGRDEPFFEYKGKRYRMDRLLLR